MICGSIKVPRDGYLITSSMQQTRLIESSSTRQPSTWSLVHGNFSTRYSTRSKTTGCLRIFSISQLNLAINHRMMRADPSDSVELRILLPIIATDIMIPITISGDRAYTICTETQSRSHLSRLSEICHQVKRSPSSVLTRSADADSIELSIKVLEDPNGVRKAVVIAIEKTIYYPAVTMLDRTESGRHSSTTTGNEAFVFLQKNFLTCFFSSCSLERRIVVDV